MVTSSSVARTPSSIIWREQPTEQKGVDGWVYCGRYTLVVLNAFFFVLGALLIGYGLWFLLVPANQNLMLVIASPTTRYNSNICMLVIVAVGICTMIFAKIGCCGAVSNSKCVLGVFFLLLIVLFMGLVTVIGFTVWLRFEIAADIQDNMIKTLMESYRGDDAVNLESVAWNSIQRGFQCCGVYGSGYLDFTKPSVEYPDGSHWYVTELSKSEPARWPESCCKAEVLSGDDMRCSDPRRQPKEVIYTEGCKEKVETFINNSLLQASGIAAALVLIEVIHFVAVKKLEVALNDST